MAKRITNWLSNAPRFLSSSSASPMPSSLSMSRIVTHEDADEREVTAFMNFSEKITPDFTMSASLHNIFFQAKSPYQDIWCLQTSPWGKMLVLDGKTQSAQADEKIYHECLVHPAMLASAHPPKSVYIGGGGEMATAREVLRHKSVERVVMVDLDEVVVSACKKHLPEWGSWALTDPRLEIHNDCAKHFLEQTSEKFDVVIMDIADPIEGGPGTLLYTQDFYQFVAEKLNLGGVLVTQSGGAGLLTYGECFTVIHNTLKATFDHTFPFSVDIPSFGGGWGFNIAMNNAQGMESKNLQNLSPADVDDLIQSRIYSNNEDKPELFFYDGISHQRIFSPPKYLRRALKEEKRVMTVENPVFMY